MIAYNAQPAAMTADMWARNYLSTINEIAAVNSNPHAWITDGPASTTYGLEPNFPCCTANHNQGWPKLATAAIFSTPARGFLCSLQLLRLRKLRYTS